MYNNYLGRMDMGGTQGAAQDQQQAMVQQIAQALQQGAKPEMLIKALMSKGLDAEQAKGIVSAVMQQMSGGDTEGMETANPFMKLGGLYKAQDGISIIDYLVNKNRDSSKEARSKLAAEKGIQGYDFSAEKNLELLRILQQEDSQGTPSAPVRKTIPTGKKPEITPGPSTGRFGNYDTRNNKIQGTSPSQRPVVKQTSPSMTEGQRIANMTKAGDAYTPSWKKKESKPTLPNKAQAKKVDNSGMDAIRAFNATNNTIPYQPNQQQAQLNPTKTKHSIQDLKTSVQSIPSNWTFGLPINVSNYIKNQISPNSNMSITNDNLSDEQKAILLETIQRSQKRNKGALSGGVDYQDYPTTIGQSAQGFMDSPTNLPQYITTAEGQLATTLGGFTYNQDPKTGEYIITDKYNFSNARDKSREGKTGKGLSGKLRKSADEAEKKNVKGESDSYWGSGANRRVGIVLNPTAIAKNQQSPRIPSAVKYEQFGPKYKTGGGYFSSYDDFTPPKMVNGGPGDEYFETSFPTPYSNQFIDAYQQDYNNFYAPPRYYGYDDGVDAYLSAKENRAPFSTIIQNELGPTWEYKKGTTEETKQTNTFPSEWQRRIDKGRATKEDFKYYPNYTQDKEIGGHQVNRLVRHLDKEARKKPSSLFFKTGGGTEEGPYDSGTYSAGVYYGDGGAYGGPILQNYMKETSPMYNFGGYFPQGPRFEDGGAYDNEGFRALPPMVQQKILRQRMYGGSYADGGTTMDGTRMGMINVFKQGGIHIDPSKRGTFTAAATKHGKSVQGFASQVLANKDNYSPAMVKKANFAKNAAKWKHEDGGIVVGQTYDATPEMLQKLQAGGYKFEYVD